MIFIHTAPLKTFKFPSGEIQISFNPDIFSKNELNRITLKYESSDDLIALLQLNDHLTNYKIKWDLTIPYLPFSRMDREMPTTSFSLRCFADLLNSFSCDQIYTFDVHSDVSRALIRNLINIPTLPYIFTFIYKSKIKDELLFISPDAGSSKKYVNNYTIQCLKKRDVDGKIQELKIYGDIEGKSGIVLDDICDGGATFIEIGKQLKEMGAKNLYLFVTHGIFSKGLDELFKYYDKVGCTNSFREYDYADKYLNKFEVIKL